MKKITEETLKAALGIIEGERAKAQSLMDSVRSATKSDDFDGLVAEYTKAAAHAAELSANAAPLLFGRARKPAKDKSAAAAKPAKAPRKPRAAKPKASEDDNITEVFVELVGDKLTKTPQKESDLAKALGATPKAVLAALTQLGTGDKPRAKRVRKGLWTKA